ncbi:unnamed protein product, partial [Owenia fusiformis]
FSASKMAASMENGSSENTDTFDVCILLLKEECDETSSNACLQTLLKIFQNVVSHPTEEKYKVIRTENKAFASKVWCYSGAQQFLLATGWTEVDDTVVLTGDSSSLTTAIKVLQAHLSTEAQNATPQKQSQSPQKQAINHVMNQDSKKAKVLDEGRKKQLEAYKRQMEEKKRIREQIEADRRETKTRESKSSKAQTVASGKGMTKFSDIGIDVNKGGG